MSEQNKAPEDKKSEQQAPQNKPVENKPTDPTDLGNQPAPSVVTASGSVASQVTVDEKLPDTEEGDTEYQEEDEMTVLKRRAQFLGIQFHPSIGVDKLREKVNLHLRKTSNSAETDVNEYEGVPTNEKEPQPIKGQYTFEELVNGYADQQERIKMNKMQRRNEALKDANKLIRVRISCFNPNKRDWQGEIFTVSNSLVGTHKKYVPFNTPEGFHVPQIIYQAIKERMCQIFVTGTDEKGNRTKRATQIPEFSVEVLPPLTKEELEELGRRQALANGKS